MSDETARLDESTRRAIEARLEGIPLARTLSVRLVRLELGECDLALDDRRDLDGIFDSLHGGILTTLADSALAFAALTLIYAPLCASLELCAVNGIRTSGGSSRALRDFIHARCSGLVLIAHGNRSVCGRGELARRAGAGGSCAAASVRAADRHANGAAGAGEFRLGLHRPARPGWRLRRRSADRCRAHSRASASMKPCSTQRGRPGRK